MRNLTTTILFCWISNTLAALSWAFCLSGSSCCCLLENLWSMCDKIQLEIWVHSEGSRKQGRRWLTDSFWVRVTGESLTTFSHYHSTVESYSELLLDSWVLFRPCKKVLSIDLSVTSLFKPNSVGHSKSGCLFTALNYICFPRRWLPWICCCLGCQLSAAWLWLQSQKVQRVLDRFKKDSGGTNLFLEVAF